MGFIAHSLPGNSPENPASLSWQKPMKDFDFHLKAGSKSLEHCQEHSEVRNNAPSKK